MPNLPQEFKAVPFPGTVAVPALRLSLIVRLDPDPASGYFLMLRQFPGGQVFLGCLVDRENRVQEWMEIWVQTKQGLETPDPLRIPPLSDEALDLRWAEQCDLFERFLSGFLMKTGWEATHPPPIYYNPALGSLVHPEGGGTDTQMIEFNPQGGLMMVTRFSPLAYEEVVDLLGGSPWHDIVHGIGTFALDRMGQELERLSPEDKGYGFLFWGSHGRSGRFLEVLHLKLHLLTSAFRLVRTCVGQQELPMLNISPESFRVRFHPVETGLPIFWTAELALVRTSHTVRIPLQGNSCGKFLRLDEKTVSDYFPRGIEEESDGQAREVTILNVERNPGNEIALSGAFQTKMDLTLYSTNDILELPLRVLDRTEVFYGHFRPDETSPDTYNFQTFPKQVDKAVAQVLERMSNSAGFERVRYKIIPILSTPVDLSALGSLAVRTLLVRGSDTTSKSIDAIRRLGRTLRSRTDLSGDLVQRVKAILDEDAQKEAPVWIPELGPHRLVNEEMEPRAALKLVPIDLWSEVLSLILRIQPGMLPDSFCRDYADAPLANLASVFTPPLEKLEDLMARTRSLLLVDWSFSREINQIIRELRGKPGAK